MAAACDVVPENIRGNPQERDSFVTESIRKMLSEGFRGKNRHLPALDAHGRATPAHGQDDARVTGPKPCRLKLRESSLFDAGLAVLRHTIAVKSIRTRKFARKSSAWPPPVKPSIGT